MVNLLAVAYNEAMRNVIVSLLAGIVICTSAAPALAQTTGYSPTLPHYSQVPNISVNAMNSGHDRHRGCGNQGSVPGVTSRGYNSNYYYRNYYNGYGYGYGYATNNGYSYPTGNTSNTGNFSGSYQSSSNYQTFQGYNSSNTYPSYSRY